MILCKWYVCLALTKAKGLYHTSSALCPCACWVFLKYPCTEATNCNKSICRCQHKKTREAVLIFFFIVLTNWKIIPTSHFSFFLCIFTTPVQSLKKKIIHSLKYMKWLFQHNSFLLELSSSKKKNSKVFVLHWNQSTFIIPALLVNLLTCKF